MSPDEDVLAALKALAEADGEKEAPAEVEARLKFAFRRKKRRPVWPWALAAAAAIVVMIGSYYLRPQRIETSPVVAVEKPKVVEPLPRVEVAREVPVVRTVPRRQRPREIMTEFFPLMDVPPPLDRAQLVRVNVPASAMRTVGIPVRDDRLMDRVQADVLVSEEGLATAVRFVKYQ